MNAAATQKKPRSRAGVLRRMRKEAGAVVALLATPDDFDTMREHYRSFRFTDYYDYLNDQQILLDSLTETSGAYVTLFDPVAFVNFCNRERLEPDSSSSRSRYAAGAAVHEVRLPYEGDELGHVLEDLQEAVIKRQGLEKAVRIIGSSSLDGMPPHAFLDRARVAVGGLLHGLGPGSHHLVCSVTDQAERLTAILHVTCADDGAPQVSQDDALAFTVHVAAGLRTGGTAGIVARTYPREAASQDVLRGWAVGEGWLRPLTEAQVFAAYCTDAATGEPIPPEHGVEYTAAYPVALPEL